MKTRQPANWTPTFTHQPPDLADPRTLAGRGERSPIRKAINQLTVGQFFQAPPETDRRAKQSRQNAVSNARKQHPDWVITVGIDADGNVWIGRDR